MESNEESPQAASPVEEGAAPTRHRLVKVETWVNAWFGWGLGTVRNTISEKLVIALWKGGIRSGQIVASHKRLTSSLFKLTWEFECYETDETIERIRREIEALSMEVLDMYQTVNDVTFSTPYLDALDQPKREANVLVAFALLAQAAQDPTLGDSRPTPTEVANFAELIIGPAKPTAA